MQNNGGVTLGKRLRQWREQKGFSQQDVADKLHVARQTVSGWERDKSEPDVANIKRLAGLFGVTTDELLENITDGRPRETLRAAALAMLFVGLAATVFTAAGGLFWGAGFLPFCIASAYGVVINLMMWFSYSGAIKNGDVALLAGYFAKAAYHPQTLARQLDAERFWFIPSSSIACIPCIFLVLWPVGFIYSLIVYTACAHIVCVLIGFHFIGKRHEDDLLPEQKDEWLKNISGRPVYFFIGSLFITLGCSAVAFDVFGVENNTPPAVAAALLMTLAFIIQAACFAAEIKKPAQAARAGTPYRMRKGVYAGFAASAAISLLMIAVCAAP